jgi:drug/metabolite transporter (DMT)-like permease
VLPDAGAAVGLLLGAAGVLIFSFTLPATKVALRSFDPWFIAFGRAVVAAALGGLILVGQRARRPAGTEWLRLGVAAGGVVIGFPALSSLALQSSSAAHGAVVIALLPAATAIAGAIRGHESPSLRFWAAAAAGTAVVTVYTFARAGGTLRAADAYLLLAVVVCAIGYAEGGLLARSLGAPQTICWALVLAAPLTVPLAVVAAPGHAPSAGALGGFLYVSLGSMLIGFFCWYGGLARAGVARASQIQLVQSPLTILWSALLLDERIGLSTFGVALAVLASVAVTQRARIGARSTPRRR